MNWLTIIGDAFWIMALAFIGATLRGLAAKIGPEVRLPLPFLSNMPKTRWPRRNLAFGIVCGVPIAIGLALSFSGRWMADDVYMPLVIFGLKTATAGAAAVTHLTWLQRAIRTLLLDGVLKS